jgi:hypothetical protein
MVLALFATWVAFADVATASTPSIGYLRHASTPLTRVDEVTLDVSSEVALDDPGTGGRRLAAASRANLRDGDVTFELIDPVGAPLYKHGGRQFTMGPLLLPAPAQPGKYTLRVTVSGAVGTCQ